MENFCDATSSSVIYSPFCYNIRIKSLYELMQWKFHKHVLHFDKNFWKYVRDNETQKDCFDGNGKQKFSWNDVIIPVW